jgi:hypothetical protein
MVYAVLPAAKYRQAVLEGDGNCSNLTCGMAYVLLESDVDYQTFTS